MLLCCSLQSRHSSPFRAHLCRLSALAAALQGAQAAVEACEPCPGLPEALLHVQAAVEAVGACTALPKVLSYCSNGVTLFRYKHGGLGKRRRSMLACSACQRSAMHIMCARRASLQDADTMFKVRGQSDLGWLLVMACEQLSLLRDSMPLHPCIQPAGHEKRSFATVGLRVFLFPFPAQGMLGQSPCRQRVDSHGPRGRGARQHRHQMSI